MPARLDLPEQRYRYQSTEPVCGDVDRCGCVVDVGKCFSCIALSALDCRVPSILDWSAVEDDVQHRDQIHGRKHCRDNIKAMGILLLVGGNTDQHE
jgi:hypothetical protein